jgi:PIN domain nuclease of toxin-antitoxin system
MRYLSDTHILLWSFEGTGKVSPAVAAVMKNTTSDVVYSPISLWEIAIKFQLGKLNIHGVTPEEFLNELNSSFFACLPLDNHHIMSSYRLPRRRGDPFDRLLIWQAISSGCTLLSADSATDLYVADGLRVIH